MILDEWEFCVHPDHELIWLQLNEEIRERELHRVQSENVMLPRILN
jgi:hypothetical protein